MYASMEAIVIRLFSMTTSMTVAALFLACAGETTTEPASSDVSADDALAGLQSCKSQELMCQGDALLPTKACIEALHACLEQLVPDAGVKPVPPIVPPLIDAGHHDGQIGAVEACLKDVKTCLVGGTSPLMCLENGRTCLHGVIAARREAGVF